MRTGADFDIGIADVSGACGTDLLFGIYPPKLLAKHFFQNHLLRLVSS